MNVQSVLRAQAFRIMRLSEPTYVPDIIKELQERYGFVGVPSKAEEILPRDGDATPIILRHGKLVYKKRTVVISELRLFAHGVAVDTPLTTKNADIVLDDLLTWAGSRVTVLEAPRFYISQLEVKLDGSFDSLSVVTSRLADHLSRLLGDYGQKELKSGFRLASLAMNVDPKETIIWSEFRIERRLGIPYGDGVYFAQAPLQTEDHLAVLEGFEEVLKEGAH